MYFLKKGTNPEYIQELIDYLYSTAQKDTDKQVFKWKSVLNEKQKKCYNIALSHGMSSIVIFLSRVINSGAADEKIMEMLFGTVNYILAQEIDFEHYGCCFPSQSLETSSPVSRSRMGWCYGDLGIGIALRQAEKAIKGTPIN